MTPILAHGLFDNYFIVLGKVFNKKQMHVASPGQTDSGLIFTQK